MNRDRVLFLDMDGVLNSDAYVRHLEATNPHRRLRVDLIDPEAVVHLDRILRETDCIVVLSSTWRLVYSLEEVRSKLGDAGMVEPERLVARTPYFPERARGFEVNAWLADGLAPAAHAILDDGRDFFATQPLVWVDPLRGLSAQDADRAIQLLTRAPP